jgi:hypothetical protein
VKHDSGHTLLLIELRRLLKDAEAFEFHDSHPAADTFPKIELYARLAALIAMNRQGKFNNS